MVYFADEFVISYLYASSYFNRYGSIPFPERPHGLAGVYDFYKEHFNVTGKAQVMGWLTASMLYQGDKTTLCPCGSRRKMYMCRHRAFFEAMTKKQIRCYENDLTYLIPKIP